MYLQEIIEHKKEENKSLKITDSVRTRPVLNPLDFLKNKPFIAEIKKASPSRGDIYPGADVTGLACLYEQGGAGAISVITDEKYFKGSHHHLIEISQAVHLPILCKDFILNELQIDNAYLHGADFILLIASILSAGEMRRLAGRARLYGMAVLYELHEFNEFEKIKALDPELVGVNSRDLKSFMLDKRKAVNTISRLPGDFLKVAESGIVTCQDIIDYKHAGADSFLVGTALMSARNPALKLQEFYNALAQPCS
jgi:indole-3-glycerol phosphate synthase